MNANNQETLNLIINNESVDLTIFGKENGLKTLIRITDSEASENGEAPIQLIEGHFYEYLLPGKYCLKPSEVVSPSRINPSSGRIAPNIFVGTLTLEILYRETQQRCFEVRIEVQSQKTSYRDDYRLMLEEITEKCVDLLLQQASPIVQNFAPNFESNSKTLYQRFSFIKSILSSNEFNDSISKILAAPVTTWSNIEALKDIRSVRRISNKAVRQIAGSKSRTNIPNYHPLSINLASIPTLINVVSKQESIDTPENRFIKHALSTFLTTVSDFRIKSKKESRLHEEASLLEKQLEIILNNSIFRDVGNPITLSLNSPVLQRKEGYKEILRVWLMHDLAAKLSWEGGDEVYEAGKKDVATLYEYWLFFQLLDLIKIIFNIEPTSIEDLIRPTKDGLCLQLKQGKHVALRGIYVDSSRELNIEFSFNRSFSGKQNYPNGGSWTKGMRPDFTLSIWPVGITQNQAEIEELIIHIHFDAKYKIDGISTIFGDDLNEDDIDNELNKEEKENDKGNFKRVDLLKMHSYKDAIRRTAGAYILYPGNSNRSYNRPGYHELVPGLGAFAIRPSKGNSGLYELKRFLNDIIQHFLNRASQREKIAFQSFDIYNNRNDSELREDLPETFGKNRSLIPDNISVLIGFYKDGDHLNWILTNKLYNFRTGTDRGSLSLGAKETNARFLVLHGPGSKISNKIYELEDSGPRIFSKSDLERKKYPKPSGDLYLVYAFDFVSEKAFTDKNWDVTKLAGYKAGRSSGIPFTASLTELMKVLVKNVKYQNE